MRLISNLLLFMLAMPLIFSSCDKETSNNHYEVVTIESDWYEVSYIEQKTYIFNEPKSSQGNVSYLILGDNRAIMFDTGSGENTNENGFRISHHLEQITELPVSLLLSHFHFDHNQNIAEFNNISFPEIDFLKFAVGGDNIYHFTSDDLFLGNKPDQVQINEWLPLNTDIDLGNKIIQIVNVPGHSRESIVVIDKTNKLAFLGDFLYNGSIFMFNKDDFSDYIQSTNYLISILDSEFRLLGAHGEPEVTFGELQTLKSFLTDIIDGNINAIADEAWGYNIERYSNNDMSLILFLNTL